MPEKSNFTNMSSENQFSQQKNVFPERPLPGEALPVGYALLIDKYGLRVPLPRTMSAIGQHSRVREEGGWRIYTPRHAPANTLEGHLTFALRYEGVDLAVLKRVFEAIGPEAVAEIVRSKPTGRYARRTWFLYEWLTGARLDIPDADTGAATYVSVLDADMQWAIKGEPSPRHRVHNNLPGTVQFCPLAFRTSTLNTFSDMDLANKAKNVVAEVPRDLLARTVAFLLLKDSKSSYAIEGEHPPQNRIQRWGRVIGEAGQRRIDLPELLRLQQIVIGDERFVKMGLRQEGGFIGEHDRETGAPIPDHISARHEDLDSLMEGLIAFDQDAGKKLDAVIAAAILAFGFVYIHPFEDGNGRIHRFLIHHILAQRGYNPAGVVFPVSSAILDRINEYKDVLESYSARLLPLIQWRATQSNNVEVLNDTADFYRYFDATPHAEFLYACVRQTIETDLPRETEFLRRYDRFRDGIQKIVDMPDRTVDLLFRFLMQNNGQLSRRAREKEFVQLTDREAKDAEEVYALAFAGLDAGHTGNSSASKE